MKVCGTVNLEVKLDVIRRMVSGDRAVDVGRYFGLPPTTVRTIYNKSSVGRCRTLRPTSIFEA